MKRYFTTLLFLTLTTGIFAQELLCRVQVEAPRNQMVDPRVFKTLENSIADFINNRRWTDDMFKDHERLRCNIVINISDMPSEGVFGGSLLIQSERPVYHSNFTSPVFTYNDRDVAFEYVEFQNLDYNDNSYSNNLTSLLAFYAYIMLGYDYESFEKDAGMPYFRKAETVVNNIPSNERSRYKGWSAFDGSRNRYVLANHLLNPRYKTYAEALYSYHRLGLDNMYNDPYLGRISITNALKLLEKVADDNPNSMLLRVFFLAKADELVNVYSTASPQEKGLIVPLLNKLDPTNAQKYNSLYNIR